MPQKGKSNLKKSILIISTFLIFAVFLKIFFINIFKVTSSSMEPTLVEGDIIYVNKMIYGYRLLKLLDYIIKQDKEYIRINGWGNVRKGDIIVFNHPDYSKYIDSSLSIYGVCYVKRCLGLPGETIQISDTNYSRKGIRYIPPKEKIFPHDSTLNWTLTDYGPIYVPTKGKSINLNKSNINWYKKFIRYENPRSKRKDGLLFVNGDSLVSYTFKKDYYFVLGDNFYNSVDSRYWGFLPFDNIIGKATVVIVSIDHNSNRIIKIRWNRLLKVL
jgi:signal peptidase I